VAALRLHRTDQAKVRLWLGPDYRDNGLVFARPTGEPIRPNSLSPAFAKLVQRAGLPQVRYHDLRHSHASQLLKIGTNPKIVSERLGHATVGLTLDTYSHVLSGVQEHAVEQFDAAMRAAIEGRQPRAGPVARRTGERLVFSSLDAAAPHPALGVSSCAGRAWTSGGGLA
jgi:integrase-like protein